jgi:hypothetical protein
MSRRTRALQARTKETLNEVRSTKTESVVEILENTQLLVEESGTIDDRRQALDVEQAKLKDVLGEQARLQETVGALIAGYDALTSSLGGEIDSMKDHTLAERLVGFFSATKAKQMREKRVQTADIDTQLQDLVVQTQSINLLLLEHLEVLEGEYVTVKKSLEDQQLATEAETATFEAKDRELEEVTLQIHEARDGMVGLEGTARISADKALQELINRANELTEARNTALSNAQTHELFAENHKIALDSLLRQKAAQRVLIDKLRISTENRIVQYAATVESLRTAAQQESAHTLNEIGTHVDQETTRTMAAIGAAADRQIVDMLERHAGNLQKRRATQAEVARADAEFARRFAAVAEKFIEDAYAESAPSL